MSVETRQQTQNEAAQIYTEAVNRLITARADILKSSKEIKDNFYKAVDVELHLEGKEVCNGLSHANETDYEKRALGIFPAEDLFLIDASLISGHKGLEIYCRKHLPESAKEKGAGVVVEKDGEKVMLLNGKGRDVTHKLISRDHVVFREVALHYNLPFLPTEIRNFEGAHYYASNNLGEIAERFAK